MWEVQIDGGTVSEHGNQVDAERKAEWYRKNHSACDGYSAIVVVFVPETSNKEVIER